MGAGIIQRTIPNAFGCFIVSRCVKCDDKGDTTMARKNTNTITKTCTKSGFTITGTPDEIAVYFYRDSSTSDGFAVWCKEAEKAYNNAYNNALKKAGVTRARDLDAKSRKVFDRAMKSERVVRGTHSNRKAKANANTNTPAKATTKRTPAKTARVFKDKA